MVKGISRQVIVLQSPQTQLFEQAIFILKENAQGITDDMLMKEAKSLLQSRKTNKRFSGPVWACAGALTTGIIWLCTIFL